MDRSHLTEQNLEEWNRSDSEYTYSLPSQISFANPTIQQQQSPSLFSPLSYGTQSVSSPTPILSTMKMNENRWNASTSSRPPSLTYQSNENVAGFRTSPQTSNYYNTKQIAGSSSDVIRDFTIPTSNQLPSVAALNTMLKFRAPVESSQIAIAPRRSSTESNGLVEQLHPHLPPRPSLNSSINSYVCVRDRSESVSQNTSNGVSEPMVTSDKQKMSFTEYLNHIKMVDYAQSQTTEELPAYSTEAEVPRSGNLEKKGSKQKENRYDNTMKALEQAGLLDIAMQTAKLIGKNNTLKKDIDMLEEIVKVTKHLMSENK